MEQNSLWNVVYNYRSGFFFFFSIPIYKEHFASIWQEQKFTFTYGFVNPHVLLSII